MILGEVVGRVWSERQHDGLDGDGWCWCASSSRRPARRGRPARHGGRDDRVLASDEAAAAAGGPLVDAAVRRPGRRLQRPADLVIANVDAEVHRSACRPRAPITTGRATGERRVDRAAGRPGRPQTRRLVGGKGAGCSRLVASVSGAGRVRGRHGGDRPPSTSSARPGSRRRSSAARGPMRPGGVGRGGGPGRGARRHAEAHGAGRRCAPAYADTSLGRGRGALPPAAAEDAADYLLRGEPTATSSCTARRGRRMRCAGARRAYTTRAGSYPVERDAGAIAVVVQRMVPAARPVSSTTLNPGQRRPLLGGLRGGLGWRAAGLRRGYPGPVPAGQDQRREGAAPEVVDKPRPAGVPARHGGTSEDVRNRSRASPCLTNAGSGRVAAHRARGGTPRPAATAGRPSSQSIPTASRCCRPARRRSGRSAPLTR